MNSNFCPNCGTQIVNGQVCPNCGFQPAMNQMDNVQQQTVTPEMNMQQQFQQMNMQMQQGVQQSPADANWKNKNATLGLIFGIVSFFIFGFLAFVGLGLAITGLKEANEHGGKGKGVAITAIVIDSICSVLVILNMIFSAIGA